MHLCSKECLKKLWPTHRFICGKHIQAMLDPTMAPMYAMDNPVFAASQVVSATRTASAPTSGWCFPILPVSC